MSPKRKPGHPDIKRKPKSVSASRAGLPAAESSNQRVCWRFKHADHDGPWPVDGMASDQFRALMGKLADCESMTAGELRGTRRFFKQYDLPDSIIDKALARLTEINLDELECIHRLEFTGTQRLYGFLHDNVFHVIWWDPRHEICPSHLRHT